MVKDDTILLLGAVGIGGYFLYKSDFFKGLSGVTSGAGQIAQDVGQVTGNIADFLNPLGATGTYLAQLLANEQTRSLRETQQAGLIDWDAFLKSRDSLVTQQATQEITKAEQKSLRVNDWEKTKTEVQDNATDVLTGFTQAGKSILFNPFSLLNVFSSGTLNNWVKSTAKSLRTTNTTSSTSGAVTSFAASASSSTGNKGVRTSILPTTSTPSILGSKILYVNGKPAGLDTGSQSIALAAIKPTISTSKSIRVKKWYDPRTW